jgi:hypothetical protein
MDKEMEEYLEKKITKIKLTDKQKFIIEFIDILFGKETNFICQSLNIMPNSEMKYDITRGVILNIISTMNTTDDMISIIDECKKTIIMLDTEFVKQ